MHTRSRNRSVALAAATLAVVAVMALSVAHTPQDYQVRGFTTRILEKLGVDDSLRYHLHTWSAELTIRFGFPEFAQLQFRKAIPHASNAAESAAAFAGYGEALLAMGARQEAEQALRRATIFDRSNVRANRILESLSHD